MDKKLNIKAHLIEVESEDIYDFEKNKNKLKDAVHIQLVISSEEALSKNKTGDLGLLNEYMIEQNIVLNLMSLQYTEILKENIKLIINQKSSD